MRHGINGSGLIDALTALAHAHLLDDLDILQPLLADAAGGRREETTTTATAPTRVPIADQHVRRTTGAGDARLPLLVDGDPASSTAILRSERRAQCPADRNIGVSPVSAATRRVRPTHISRPRKGPGAIPGLLWPVAPLG